MEDAAEGKGVRTVADADEAMLVWTGAHKDGVSDDRRRGPFAGGRGDGVGMDRGTSGERLRRDGGWVVDHKSER
jgi:hypothetical protein